VVDGVLGNLAGLGERSGPATLVILPAAVGGALA
jgi:hypothetical protein